MDTIPSDFSFKGLSSNPSDCLILGNGDVGLNLRWAEDGAIEGYLSKTDAWDEIGRLVKVARFRLTISVDIQDFEVTQSLFLNPGRAILSAVSGDQSFSFIFWVDAQAPLLWIETDFSIEKRITWEWIAMRPHSISSNEIHPSASKGIDGAPQNFIISEDLFDQHQTHSGVYHRNQDSIYSFTLSHQGLSALIEKFPDPLINHCFGAWLGTPTPTQINEKKIIFPPALKRSLQVSILSGSWSDPEPFLDRAHRQVTQHLAIDCSTARLGHDVYWQKFWNQSWIEVEGPMGGALVSKGYRFQRYMHACAGRGSYPIKFNGSIFNTETQFQREVFSADDRLWGGGYWFQNTRFTYWASLVSGDFELFKSFFEIYFRALDFGKARTKIWENHSGSIFPETMYFWGSHIGQNYGWDRKGKNINEIENRYIGRHINGALEFIAIGFDYWKFTNDPLFLTQKLIPAALEVLTYFDQHFPKREKNYVQLYPAQALEMYHDTLNPTPDIAGLKYICKELLDVLDHLHPLSIDFVERFSKQIPEISTRKLNCGKELIAPAEKIYGEPMNLENPELYCVFPFPLFGFTKPDLKLALETFHHRMCQMNGCWRQDAIQAACLGLMETARSMVHESAMQPYNPSNPSRFPAFWGSPFDWAPDQDHGGVLMITLQKMLVQFENEKIYLFPAWPKEWNVKFKINAPYQTVIEGEYRGGKLEILSVLPESRRKNVEFINLQ